MLKRHYLPVPFLLVAIACQENPLMSAPVSSPPAAKPQTAQRETPPQSPHPEIPSDFQDPPLKKHVPKNNVSQISLDNLFNKSKKIVVRKSEVNGQILYESNKKPDLALLHDVMRIAPPKGEVVSCRHVGAPVIEFYFKKRYVGWVALHDGVTIRTSFWNTDGEILDKERFLKWFDRRGIAGPRRRAQAEGYRSPKSTSK